MPDEAAQDLKAFGVDTETANEAAGQPAPALYPVDPENAPTVEMFLRLSTQWQHGEAGPIGLRYESALAVMRLYAVKDKRTMLDDLRTMERAALKALSSRK